MYKGLKRVRWIVLFILSCDLLSAGSLKPLVFQSSKEQVLDIPTSLKDLMVTYGKVQRACTDNAALTCINYDLVIPKGFDVSSWKAKINAVLTMWSSVQHTNLRLKIGETKEVETFFGVPSDPGIVSGNFIISFAPPNEYFKNEKRSMVVLNRAEYQEPISKITHSTIYVNPAILTANFSAAIANGIGQSLGLGPTAVRKSLMADELLAKEPELAASYDDVQWLGYLYGDSVFKESFGSISGRVVNGLNKSPWVGAHVGILSKKNIISFTETLNRDLLEGSTFSNEKGDFILPTIPAGDYVLVSEPRNYIPQGIIRFNEVLDILFSKEIFEPEFYDGGGRESNRESAYGFSPQGIQFAASLHVDANKETSRVEVITNVADSKIEILKASGSSNETLSSIEGLQREFKSEPVPAQASEGSLAGGCEIQPKRITADFSMIFILIFALALCSLRRQGQRAK